MKFYNKIKWSSCMHYTGTRMLATHLLAYRNVLWKSSNDAANQIHHFHCLQTSLADIAIFLLPSPHCTTRLICCSLQHNSWCKIHSHWHHNSVAIAHWLLSACLLLRRLSYWRKIAAMPPVDCCLPIKFSLLPLHAARQQLPQWCCCWPCICARDAAAVVAG